MTAPSILSDRYLVERELGRGGMAVVYLARDRKHDRWVAIKVLRPEITAGLGPERFLLEVQILAQLQHPHILGLIDSGATEESAPRPYYVMPYIEGETLRQRIERERQLPVDEAFRLIREIGEALAYAHGEGMIHRDVKPENVLLSRGHPLVADFGIARAVRVAAGERLTETGLSLGTPAYMSPEQASGTRDVDARSDQYSLACVLYELLGGQPPFTGPNAGAVLSRHVLDPVPSLAALRPGVPRFLQAAIERALAKTPVDRFGSVAEFLAALEAQEESKAPEKSIVVLPFANLSPDPDNEYFADGLMEELIADLSKVRALKVISRTSAIKLKGTDWDLRRIGRELNVRYVLEGSVRKAGNSLRITAQLIDAETDAHLWAEKYSGTMDDVFELQERLSRQIVDALEITLTPDEDRKLAERPIKDPSANEYYQRARQEYFRFTMESQQQARNLARRALDIVGPNEVLFGLCGTIDANSVLFGEPEDVALAGAEAWAQKAFAVNRESCHGHIILGSVAYRRGHLKEMARQSQRALEVEPANIDALLHQAGALLLAGRLDRARSTLLRLLERDPLTALNHCFIGVVEVFGGNPEAAQRPHERAEELDPLNVICRSWHAVALAHAGRRDEATTHFDVLARQHGEDVLAKVVVRLWRALQGKRAAVLEPLSDTERATSLSDESWAYFMAAAYALVGETDEALTWLEHTVKVRGWIDYIFFTQHEPFLKSLHPDPRFQALMAYAKEQYEQFDA